MLAPCRQAELPSLCTRPEDHRQLFPKPCLIPLLTQPAHGCDNDTRGQGWLSPAVQRPFPLSPRECELPATPGTARGMAPLPRDTGQGGGEGMHRHAHTESRQRWKTKTSFNRDLLLQQPYWFQILLPGPGNPSAHKEERSRFILASP